MSEWPFTPEVEGGGWQIAVTEDANGYVSYLIDRPNIRETPEQLSANVNLIAAAPRMYRALKAVLADPWEENSDATYREVEGVINWIDGHA